MNQNEEKSEYPITIIGQGRGWEFARGNEVGEVWGVNYLILWRDIDLLFHIHDMDMLRSNDQERVFTELIIDRINETRTPTYLYKPDPAIKTGIVFPLDEYIAEFGTDYFAHSFAFMFAHAIHVGVTEINTYGFNMASSLEYFTQKACAEFWIGYAMAKGIKVNIHGQEWSSLLETQDHKIYVYDREQARPKSFIKLNFSGGKGGRSDGKGDKSDGKGDK